MTRVPQTPSAPPSKPRVYRPARRRRPRWGRIVVWALLGILLVALTAGGGYYLWLRHVVAGANARLDPGVSEALKSSPPSSVAVPASPGTMDVLLLGSDQRAGVAGGRSDTIMLIHIDSQRGFASMFSLPRDLRVEVPGHGLQRLNTAYSFGGAALAIRTVKQLTGINIDHYLQVDFQAFQKMADSLGGVYIDVDRRYLNTDASYEPIDIQPGYQLLGGHDALEYVRYRHDGNADFGRMLRQQRFLSALKEQIGAAGAGLLLKLPGLAGDLFSNATTDLTADQVLSLAYFGARLGGGHIRQVRLTGDTPTINGVSYVTATQADIRQAVQDYLTPLSAESTTTSAAAMSTGTTGLQDAAAWRSLAATVPFAVEAPTYLPAGYAASDQYPRTGGSYVINTGRGKAPALRMIYRYQDRDQYLGVSETSWSGAPIASPGTAIQANGVTYMVVGTEGKVNHVWWKKSGVLFWVSNTLSYLLPQDEMLRMAESFQPLPAP